MDKRVKKPGAITQTGVAIGVMLLLAAQTGAQRQMENLGRGDGVPLLSVLLASSEVTRSSCHWRKHTMERRIVQAFALAALSVGLVTAPTTAAEERWETQPLTLAPGECDLPHHPPDRVIDAPPWVHFSSVAIAPRSGRVLVSRVVRVVDLWPALTQFWFEAVGCIAFAAVAVLLWRVRHEGRRWLIVLLLALLMALPGGIVLFQGLPPRDTWLGRLMDWPSGRAYTWATEHQQEWLLCHVREWADVVEIDPGSGRVLRPLRSRCPSELPHKTRPGGPRALGDSYVASSQGGPAITAGLFASPGSDAIFLVWYDVSGHIISPIERISLGSDGPPEEIPWPPPDAPEGSLAYLGRFAGTRNGDGFCVVATPPEADPPQPDLVFGWGAGAGWKVYGSLDQSYTYLMYIARFDGKPFMLGIDSKWLLDILEPHLLPMPEPHHILLLLGNAERETGPAFLEGTLVDLRRGERRDLFRVEEPAAFRDAAAVRLAEGVAGLVIRDLDADGVWRIRGENGELVGTLEIPQIYEFAEMAASPDGRHLFLDHCEAKGPVALIDVLDLTDGRWGDRLSYPKRPGRQWRRLVVSETLAVLELPGQTSSLAARATCDRLIIWDLGELGTQGDPTHATIESP